MTEECHRQALTELRTARARLIVPDDIRACAELSFGMAFHLLALGVQRRYGAHRENHEGLGRWLRARGHLDVADVWGQLENFRTGRWYGRQGNGDAAMAIDQLLEQLEAWSLAPDRS
ncbi:MAG: hypothetical protein HYY04_10395 [Chloroflexi bacterium]|nr:hypothetical protein [Chloroflexota bacterium]